MRQSLECAPVDWGAPSGAGRDEPSANALESGGDRLDAATAAYVTAMQLPFQQVRQAAAQFAAVLVLAASGARHWAGHPMLAMADEARRAAEDAIRAAAVPAAARHHHRHLIQAVDAIAEAGSRLRTASIRRNDAAIDAVVAAVKAAHRELQWSTAALPGFAMVDLAQCCCAAHRGLQRPPPA